MLDFEFSVGIGTIYCDNPDCDCSEDYSVESWLELIDESKADGWFHRYINGEWYHFCESCVENYGLNKLIAKIKK